MKQMSEQVVDQTGETKISRGLVVDDDAASRKLMSKTLQRNGFEVLENEEVKQVSTNDPDIRHKLVETLYLNSGSALIGSMLAVAILIVIFYAHVSLGALAVWGGYMLVVSLGRYSLLRNYKSSASGAQSSNQWAVYFYTGTTMNGLGWGAAVWVLFTPEALLHRSSSRVVW